MNQDDLRGLIFSAVVFGSLGAIMDVAMSLASSLFEVYENEKRGGGKAYAISRASARMTKDFVGSVVIPSLLPFDEEWLEIK